MNAVSSWPFMGFKTLKGGNPQSLKPLPLHPNTRKPLNPKPCAPPEILVLGAAVGAVAGSVASASAQFFGVRPLSRLEGLGRRFRV